MQNYFNALVQQHRAHLKYMLSQQEMILAFMNNDIVFVTFSFFLFNHVTLFLISLFFCFVPHGHSLCFLFHSVCEASLPCSKSAVFMQPPPHPGTLFIFFIVARGHGLLSSPYSMWWFKKSGPPGTVLTHTWLDKHHLMQPILKHFLVFALTVGKKIKKTSEVKAVNTQCYVY